MSWIIFVIMVVAILIGSLFRGGRQPPRTFDRQPDDSEARRPRRPLPPPVPRKRLVPPPRPRVLEAVQVVVPVVRERAQPPPQVAPAQPSLGAPPRVAFKTATVEVLRQTSPAALQLVALLKNRESVRTAILLREVLASPLCKRHRHG